MDELLIWIFLVIWILGSVKSKNKKTKKTSDQQASQRTRPATKEYRSMQEAFEQMARDQNEQSQETAKPAKSPFHEMGKARPQEYQVMKPEVAVSDGLEDAYGSLAFDSSEGESLYEDDLDQDDAFDVRESVYTNEITSGIRKAMTTRNIVQGVIMSEVLKRPHQRGYRND